MEYVAVGMEEWTPFKQVHYKSIDTPTNCSMHVVSASSPRRLEFIFLLILW